LLSPWVVHHDAQYYTEPETFQPERWDKTSKQPIPRYAYFPFGGGQRLCVGNIFAMVEARLVFATLAQRWSFSLPADSSLELIPSITIRPKNGITLIAHKRG